MLRQILLEGHGREPHQIGKAASSPFYRIGSGAIHPAGNTDAIATPIRDLRRAAGLSQERLAAPADTSTAQIARLENGQRKLTREWAERLAGPLNTTWQVVIGASAPGFAESSAMNIAEAAPSEWHRLPEVSAALSAMLADIGVPLGPARLTALAQKTLRDISALDRRLPFEDRLELAVSEVRSRQLNILE